MTITLDNITRGESKSYTFEVTKADGTLMDLTGKKIIMTLRILDVVIIEKKSATVTGGSSSQIAVVALGRARIFLDPADTASLDPVRLYGDLWVYTDGTDPVAVAHVRVAVEQAQTRAFP